MSVALCTIVFEEDDVMKKMVNGAWEGWKGDTILQLTDGSKWEQVE